MGKFLKLACVALFIISTTPKVFSFTVIEPTHDCCEELDYHLQAITNNGSEVSSEEIVTGAADPKTGTVPKSITTTIKTPMGDGRILTQKITCPKGGGGLSGSGCTKTSEVTGVKKLTSGQAYQCGACTGGSQSCSQGTIVTVKPCGSTSRSLEAARTPPKRDGTTGDGGGASSSGKTASAPDKKAASANTKIANEEGARQDEAESLLDERRRQDEERRAAYEANALAAKTQEEALATRENFLAEEARAQQADMACNQAEQQARASCGNGANGVQFSPTSISSGGGMEGAKATLRECQSAANTYSSVINSCKSAISSCSNACSAASRGCGNIGFYNSATSLKKNNAKACVSNAKDQIARLEGNGSSASDNKNIASDENSSTGRSTASSLGGNSDDDENRPIQTSSFADKIGSFFGLGGNDDSDKSGTQGKEKDTKLNPKKISTGSIEGGGSFGSKGLGGRGSKGVGKASTSFSNSGKGVMNRVPSARSVWAKRRKEYALWVKEMSFLRAVGRHDTVFFRATEGHLIWRKSNGDNAINNVPSFYCNTQIETCAALFNDD